MSNVIIQAQEQKGLKNQDYPNGYYPFFNGNSGITPAPTYFSYALSGTSVLKTVVVDFDYHTPPQIGVVYETIWAVRGTTEDMELQLYANGEIKLTMGAQGVSITIPNGTYRQWDYVKLRLELSPLTLTLYDDSVEGISTLMGTTTVAWNPTWTYNKEFVVGALYDGTNYLKGFRGFIGDITTTFFDASVITNNTLTRNNTGLVFNSTRTFNPRNNYPQTRIELFILDTLKDETITSIRKAASIESPGKIKSNFTQAFSIPFSDANNKFFAHCYDINVTADYFNQYKRSYVTISNTTGNVIVSGSMLLNTIDQLNLVYNVTIYGEATTLWESMQDKLLSDLSADFWDTYDHKNTVANIEASWTGGLVNMAGNTIPDLYYPVETYGTETIDPNIAQFITNTLNYQAFRPSMKVKTLFDQIMKEAGYEYESTFLSTTEFTDLYLGLAPNKELSIVAEAYSYVSAGNLFGGGVTLPDIQSNVSPYNSHSFTWKNIPMNVDDPDSAFDQTTGLYTPIETGLITFDFNFLINTNVSPWGSQNAKLSVIPTDTNGATANINIVGAPQTSVRFTQSGTIYIAQETFKMTVYCIKNVSFAFTINLGNFSSISTLGQILLGFSFKTVKIANVSIVDQVRNESMYGIKLKQQELLSGLTTMFNLVWDKVDSNTFKIEPFKEWLAGGDEVDWTEKIDKGGLIGNNIKSRSKSMEFEYKKSPDALIERTISEREVPPNSGSFNPNNTDWLEKDKTLKVPWIAPVLQQAGKGEVFYPQRYELEDGIPKAIDGAHIMGYKVSYATSPDVQILDVGSSTFKANSTMNILSPYKNIPLTNSTKTLEFNLFGNVFNHIVGRSPVNLFKNIAYNSLFNEYWYPWFNEVYSDNAKMFTAKFNLNPEDSAIKLNTKIFIKNAWYRINKINTPQNTNGLSKLELIKLVDFDVNNFAAYNCDMAKTGLTDGVFEFTFYDPLPTLSFGTKDCCDAVNGLWYASPIDVDGLYAGQFRCYSGEQIVGVKGQPTGYTYDSATNWVCMEKEGETSAYVSPSNVAARLADGWSYC
jgi:hypothetical protein